MSSRRASALAAVSIVVLAALVPVGRWERGRAAREENAGMRRTLALVGPLGSRSLSGYRVLAGFDCLTYRRGENPFALEVCFDGAGRVVETIDRRTATRRISSLREDPTRSTIRIDLTEAHVLLRKMEAR
ncbi:MAG: hypothetical protein ACRDL2_00870 [Gaiellaceae bacterium]